MDSGSIPLKDADREKQRVALSSVVAAVFLTSMKLVVGLLTGSLGILAEAAHSALDLIAAAVTLLAVRLSGRPASSSYTYGHGKIENLSALFETVLLLVTCLWIIYEAIQRLFFHPVAVEATLPAFAVMGISILIDFTRSRVLARAAKKYQSQALEADALHFSTDIWSSSVVIGGLLLVFASRQLSITWLEQADAVAALGVACIVVYVSVQLGRRTIIGLLDGIPAGLREEILLAAKVPGVMEVKRVRVRRSGAEAFVDVVLLVPPNISLDGVHQIVAKARERVRSIIPRADVVVEVDSEAVRSEGVLDTVRQMAARQGLGVHSVHLYDIPGSRLLELHLEVSDALRVDQAHTLSGAFEESLHTVLPDISEIVTHIEPAGDSTLRRAASPEDEARLMRSIHAVADSLAVKCEPHQVNVRRVEGDLVVTFHCLFSPDITIREAHALTEQFERALRAREPELGRVVIHVEPDSDSTAENGKTGADR
jgi:cation diffusion facilitator family transporter